jgi:hypothetical protein
VATDPGERERVEPRLPVPRLRAVEPLATVSAGFFGSADFYVRIGVIAIVVLALFSVLLTRLWALQVIHGSDLRHVAVSGCCDASRPSRERH